MTNFLGEACVEMLEWPCWDGYQLTEAASVHPTKSCGRNQKGRRKKPLFSPKLLF